MGVHAPLVPNTTGAAAARRFFVRRYGMRRIRAPWKGVRRGSRSGVVNADPVRGSPGLRRRTLARVWTSQEGKRREVKQRASTAVTPPPLLCLSTAFIIQYKVVTWVSLRIYSELRLGLWRSGRGAARSRPNAYAAPAPTRPPPLVIAGAFGSSPYAPDSVAGGSRSCAAPWPVAPLVEALAGAAPGPGTRWLGVFQ